MHPHHSPTQKAVVPLGAGITSDNVASRYNVPRDLQDRLASESHAKAKKAQAREGERVGVLKSGGGGGVATRPPPGPPGPAPAGRGGGAAGGPRPPARAGAPPSYSPPRGTLGMWPAAAARRAAGAAPAAAPRPPHPLPGSRCCCLPAPAFCFPPPPPPPPACLPVAGLRHLCRRDCAGADHPAGRQRCAGSVFIVNFYNRRGCTRR